MIKADCSLYRGLFEKGAESKALTKANAQPLAMENSCKSESEKKKTQKKRKKSITKRGIMKFRFLVQIFNWEELV